MVALEGSARERESVSAKIKRPLPSSVYKLKKYAPLKQRIQLMAIFPLYIPGAPQYFWNLLIFTNVVIQTHACSRWLYNVRLYM
jgi:hypothetical protein